MGNKQSTPVRPSGAAGTPHGQDTTRAPPSHDATRHPNPQDTTGTPKSGSSPSEHTPTPSASSPCGSPQSQQQQQPGSYSPPRSAPMTIASSINALIRGPSLDHETNPSFASFWQAFPPAQLAPSPPPSLPPPKNKEQRTLEPDELDPSNPPPPKPINPDYLDHQVSIYSAQTSAFVTNTDITSEDLAVCNETLSALTANLASAQQTLTNLLVTPILPLFPPRSAKKARAEQKRKGEVRCVKRDIAAIEERIPRLQELKVIITAELTATITKSLRQDFDSGGNVYRAQRERERQERKKREEGVMREEWFLPQLEMDLVSKSRWRGMRPDERLVREREEVKGPFLRQQMDFQRWYRAHPWEELPEDFLMRPLPRWWGVFRGRGVWVPPGGKRVGVREEVRFGEFVEELEKLRERVELDGLLIRETRGGGKRRGEYLMLTGEVRRAMEEGGEGDGGYYRDKVDWEELLGLEVYEGGGEDCEDEGCEDAVVEV
ncbi:hypothetical protein QBC41DRAFT_282082 [Cercophora samala]|uniref:Uncharacterized protein n=1 Tax=Cercophora samala TaxID=330535 RepID=A0AA40D7D0_9PEZI|nr:hypothetical protein QBC41DRAFT_282082 [Cercophora samala]